MEAKTLRAYNDSWFYLKVPALCGAPLRRIGATDVPKAHPCWDGSVEPSVALRSLVGYVSLDHRVISGRHG
jgi:hypothetical protein